MAVRGKLLSIGLLTLALATAANQEGAFAQQRPSDFTELPLEELIRTDVISINVLGTHIHLAGQWMLSYRYMLEDMDGNRTGVRRISIGKVLEEFDVAPTNMTMEMHMGMVMYAPSDDLTLMAMLPFIRKDMSHVTREGVRFNERSEGIGDLQVNALYAFFDIDRYRHRFLLNAGVSFPTGSIDKKDFGPDRALGKSRLEYPMQLGSGTVDLLPGVTYLGQTEQWAWLAEFIPTIRLGRNKNDYQLGNRYLLTARAAWKWTDWLSLSGRVDGEIWENVRGADPTLNPEEEPTKDPNRQGGKRIDLSFGVNLYAPHGILKGHRLAIEAGAPVYQRLDGPQLQTDWFLRIGWQWVF